MNTCPDCTTTINAAAINGGQRVCVAHREALYGAHYGVKSYTNAYDAAHVSFAEALAIAARIVADDPNMSAAVYYVPTDRPVLMIGVRYTGEPLVCDRDGKRVIDVRDAL